MAVVVVWAVMVSRLPPDSFAAPAGSGKAAALTGCVACQNVPLTGCVVAEPSVLTELVLPPWIVTVPETGWVTADPSTFTAAVLPP